MWLREGLKMPDANYWRSEMDITYREIQEIKDQLAELQERESVVWGYVVRSGKAADKALKEGNIAEYQEIKHGSSAFSYEHSELQNKIRDLKSRKQALWDQHNEAKAEWRRLRGS